MKRGSFLDILIDISFEIEFLFNRKYMVCCQKWLEGHVAPPPPPPPKSQFRGQGIHTAILLRDFERSVTGKPSGPSFGLRTSNYPL